MRIKTNRNSDWIRNILWTFGGILLLSIAAQFPKAGLSLQKGKDLPPTPDSILQFVQQEQTFPQVLRYFDSYLVFLSVKDDTAQHLPEAIRQMLEQRGSKKIRSLHYQDSYAAVLKDGKIVKEQLRGKSPASLKYKGIRVRSGGGRVGNFSRLETPTGTEESDHTGFNVFILNPKNSDLFLFSFDYHNQKAPTSKGSHGFIRLSNLETVTIKLTQKHLQKLAKKREKALESGVLLTSDEDYVPAQVSYRDKDLRAEVRLKGDWTDHLDGEKWSFRVKLNRDQRIHGMRKFSLHHPKTRAYAGEWIFHQLLKQEGILNLQYRFVQVEIVVDDQPLQQKFLGTYAMEEAFDKYLIERNQKRESVILKLDEDPIWQERAAFFNQGLNFQALDFSGLIQDQHLSVLPFGESKTLSDPTLRQQFEAGRQLFSGYLNGHLPISEVFDVDLLAKYNAICNLMGADHALIPHNLRVYYNPVNARLEPIGFDADAGAKIWQPKAYHLSKNDPVYMQAYARELARVSSREYIEKIPKLSGLSDILALLAQEFPEYKWNPDFLEHNTNVIYNALFPQKCLNVHLEAFQQDGVLLSVENFGPFPVRVDGIQKKGGKVFAFSDSSQIVLPNETSSIFLTLDANFRQLFVKKKQKDAQFDTARDIRDVQLLWRTLGTQKQQTVEILPWSHHPSVEVYNDLFRKKVNIESFNFLEIDEREKTITCKPGEWILNKNLIIPKGYTFKAGPGCVIQMQNYLAKIISFSPLEFKGTPSKPVVIKSDTEQGRGIIVLETADTSIIQHCKFINLSNPGTSGWAVTGAINFYEAPVRIRHTSFLKNRSEDALNIIRTWFEMDSVIFAETQSDAFDGDFVQGSIRNSVFGDLGNDAIDVSGSDILVENVDILKAGDKGLSAGESSQMQVKNVSISLSEIGIASKDKSFFHGEDIILKNNKLGFTAFQKKPEFGVSTIQVQNVQLTTNELDYLIEEGSRLTLDGTAVQTSKQVKDRMYGVEFGKESE